MQVALGLADGAELEAHRLLRPRGPPAHQLGAAAADVHDHHRPVAVHGEAGAGERDDRLLDPAQQPHRRPEAALDQPGDVVPVGRVAHRAGGHRQRPRGRERRDVTGVAGEDAIEALEGVGGDRAVGPAPRRRPITVVERSPRGPSWPTPSHRNSRSEFDPTSTTARRSGALIR